MILLAIAATAGTVILAAAAVFAFFGGYWAELLDLKTEDFDETDAGAPNVD